MNLLKASNLNTKWDPLPPFPFPPQKKKNSAPPPSTGQTWFLMAAFAK